MKKLGLLVLLIGCADVYVQDNLNVSIEFPKDSDEITTVDSGVEEDAGPVEEDVSAALRCLNGCSPQAIDACVVALDSDCLTQLGDCRSDCVESCAGDVFDVFSECGEAGVNSAEQRECVNVFCATVMACPWLDNLTAWYDAYLCTGGERILK